MWHASFVASVDNWQVGVRSDDADATRQLQLLIGDLLSQSPDPPSGYSVVAHPARTTTRSQPLAELRHGPRVVLRSRYIGRLAAATASHIIALGHASQPVLRLAFSLVIRDSVGIMLHPQLLRMPGLEPLLVRAGWDISDTPDLAVHTFDTAAVDVFCWSDSRTIAETATVALNAILVPHDALGHGSSRSAALAYLMALGPKSSLEPQDHLEQAARLTRLLKFTTPADASHRAVFAALEDAHRRSPTGAS